MVMARARLCGTWAVALPPLSHLVDRSGISGYISSTSKAVTAFQSLLPAVLGICLLHGDQHLAVWGGRLAHMRVSRAMFLCTQ